MITPEIKDLLESSINVVDFQEKLKIRIHNISSVILPVSHLQDLERMAKSLEGYEAFFHATQESLSQISGDNPEKRLESARGDFLKALRSDRDIFCEEVSKIQAKIKGNEVHKKHLRVYRDALQRSEEISEKAVELLNEGSGKVRPVSNFKELKWLGYRMFKLLFTEKLKTEEQYVPV